MEALASQCWLMENQLVYVSVLVACARMMDDPLFTVECITHCSPQTA